MSSLGDAAIQMLGGAATAYNEESAERRKEERLTKRAADKLASDRKELKWQLDFKRKYEKKNTHIDRDEAVERQGGYGSMEGQFVAGWKSGDYSNDSDGWRRFKIDYNGGKTKYNAYTEASEEAKNNLTISQVEDGRIERVAPKTDKNVNTYIKKRKESIIKHRKPSEETSSEVKAMISKSEESSSIENSTTTHYPYNPDSEFQTIVAEYTTGTKGTAGGRYSRSSPGKPGELKKANLIELPSGTYQILPNSVPRKVAPGSSTKTAVNKNLSVLQEMRNVYQNLLDDPKATSRQISNAKDDYMSMKNAMPQTVDLKENLTTSDKNWNSYIEADDNLSELIESGTPEQILRATKALKFRSSNVSGDSTDVEKLNTAMSNAALDYQSAVEGGDQTVIKQTQIALRNVRDRMTKLLNPSTDEGVKEKSASLKEVKLAEKFLLSHDSVLAQRDRLYEVARGTDISFGADVASFVGAVSKGFKSMGELMGGVPEKTLGDKKAYLEDFYKKPLDEIGGEVFGAGSSLDWRKESAQGLLTGMLYSSTFLAKEGGISRTSNKLLEDLSTVLGGKGSSNAILARQASFLTSAGPTVRNKLETILTVPGLSSEEKINTKHRAVQYLSQFTKIVDIKSLKWDEEVKDFTWLPKVVEKKTIRKPLTGLVQSLRAFRQAN